ncbi:hypothetical protein [Bdellovibrio svalbardensis]|uniref:DUF4344 domain-containing metallopeptidase n=1 Tax=Bdellovibrio svalbardensis TaxID=2972972 RepID=A0ABT6DIX1_9BACT|nr:hypothetical protein [Bdellovibrio svalbardensis]MDG0816794.1 DUF4344 domain-containing metallopeptidase [Bdellovibrio svalbardensis]
MIKLLLILSGVFSLLQAQPVPDASSNDVENSQAVQEMIQKIGQVREALKISAASSQACETPTSRNCSFGGYCGEFADKAQSFYLYQDEDGHQIPNFQMLSYMRVGEACTRQPFPQALVSDPFVYPELLVSAEKAGGAEQQKKNLARFNKELGRARSIFADAQKRMVKVLESRRTKGNAAEINNMITRIKTAKFVSPKLGDGIYSLSAEGCESPNAFYEPSKHSVTVCPQFLNLPDAALFTTLSHELGHAIDPCSVAFSYSQGKKDLELNYPTFMGGSGEKGKIKISAIPTNKNPLASVISCLQKPSSIGVQVPSKSGLINKINEEEDALREEAAANSEEGGEGGEQSGIPKGELGDATIAGFEDQRKIINTHYDAFKGCSEFTGSGHLQEAWSDWLAAETLAGKIKDIPDSKKARQYAFASESVFLSIGCENVKQSVVSKIKAVTMGKCPFLDEVESLMAEASAEGSGTHPSTDLRVDRVMFAKPEIQKALGCKASSENNGSECK